VTDREPKTAAELMAELEADDEWLQRRDERERQRQSRAGQNQADAAPVLAAVAEATGVEVASISELRDVSSPAVVAVLIEWLSEVDNVHVKRDIASALSSEWARPIASEPLLTAFEAASGDGAHDGLRWSIASALSEVADKSVSDRLVQLVQDRSSGAARQMLVIALGRSGDKSVVPVLVELLDEYEIAGHVVMALAELHALEARSEIEKLRADDRRWVRDEVRRALAELS
jgi:HEAT repeat protein